MTLNLLPRNRAAISAATAAWGAVAEWWTNRRA